MRRWAGKGGGWWRGRGGAGVGGLSCAFFFLDRTFRLNLHNVERFI